MTAECFMLVGVFAINIFWLIGVFSAGPINSALTDHAKQWTSRMGGGEMNAFGQSPGEPLRNFEFSD